MERLKVCIIGPSWRSSCGGVPPRQQEPLAEHLASNIIVVGQRQCSPAVLGVKLADGAVNACVELLVSTAGPEGVADDLAALGEAHEDFDAAGKLRQLGVV